MELLGRGRELLREGRHLIGLALHGGDRATDLLDHAIEAPLEEAELVGLTCRRAHGQIAPLRLPHHAAGVADPRDQDRKSTRLNSSHGYISYAVFCLKKKNT